MGNLTEHQIPLQGKVDKTQARECWEANEVTLGNQNKNSHLMEFKQQEPHFLKYLVTSIALEHLGFMLYDSHLVTGWPSPPPRSYQFSVEK